MIVGPGSHIALLIPFDVCNVIDRAESISFFLNNLQKDSLFQVEYSNIGILIDFGPLEPWMNTKSSSMQRPQFLSKKYVLKCVRNVLKHIFQKSKKFCVSPHFLYNIRTK